MGPTLLFQYVRSYWNTVDGRFLFKLISKPFPDRHASRRMFRHHEKWGDDLAAIVRIGGRLWSSARGWLAKEPNEYFDGKIQSSSDTASDQLMGVMIAHVANDPWVWSHEWPLNEREAVIFTDSYNGHMCKCRVAQ